MYVFISDFLVIDIFLFSFEFFIFFFSFSFFTYKILCCSKLAGFPCIENLISLLFPLVHGYFLIFHFQCVFVILPINMQIHVEIYT